ncbi:MAG: beta-ketoacyl-[acyl-carrier-protein] synthase family protein [Proteobacteria bacterium]|nr:beta-ketoacyl-[acyl-carrier-protein] synthase family protein [Pseudomonadota bacterium]
MKNRVVITSMGLFSSLGSDPEAIVENILKDRVTFERPVYDPTTAVSPVHDFNLKDHTGRFKDARYLNRGVEFALAAALKAINASKLRPDQCERAGLFVGSGPNMDLGGECPDIRDGQIVQDPLPALFLLRFLPNTAASAISRLAGIHGENLSVGSACAASMMAVGEAFRKVKDGYLDLAFAGGGDSRLSPGGILAYKKAQALWQGIEDPRQTYAPFDVCRTGFVAGEGGASVLIESLDHAKARGARILAEICGYGSAMDGYTMTAPEPQGTWAEHAVQHALSEAGLNPGDVDLISTHGTGTVLNDRMEAGMIQRVFKGHSPKITALKSWIGHLASACGAVELALCLSCLELGLFPGVRNLVEPLNPELHFLKAPTSMNPRTILLENFGFGGQNSALVIQSWKP